MKIRTAGISTGVVEVNLPIAVRQAVTAGTPGDDLLAKHLAQNARTWAVLQQLGVREGAELSLSFAFRGGGAALAEHLTHELGYTAEAEAEGVSGCTTPMALSPRALDEWVGAMLRLGAFSGWTATVRRPA
jgi:hypothetical protein